MTTTAAPATTPLAPTATLARPAGPVADAYHLAARQVRNQLREPFSLIPAMIIPIFFFFVNTGSLSTAAERFGIADPAGFFLPVSILFAVSNGGAGLSIVRDIETGYFDKLLLTPTRRLALLIGSMGAEFVTVVVQALLVVAVGALAGVIFGLGLPGVVGLVLIAALWGLAYSGIGYAIALKTGNSQATQSAFVLFFPFVFLTTSFLPEEALSGWLATAAGYNPVTYLLAGLRSLLSAGFDAAAVGGALAAVAAVGAVTISAALAALRGRVR